MDDDGLVIPQVAGLMNVDTSFIDLFLSGDGVTADPSLAGKLETAPEGHPETKPVDLWPDFFQAETICTLDAA